MDFHGHINLRDNEMQKMVLQAETTFPTPTVGRLCFKDSRVWICIDATTPVWAPLSATTNTYVHTQSSSGVTWTIPHNLNTVSPIVQVYDSSNKMIIPQAVEPASSDTVVVTLESTATGYAVVMSGAEGDPNANSIYQADALYNYSQGLRAYWKGEDTIVYSTGTEPSFVQYGPYDYGGGPTPGTYSATLTSTSPGNWNSPTSGNVIISEMWFFDNDSSGYPSLGTVTIPSGFTNITTYSYTFHDATAGAYVRAGFSVSYKISNGTETSLQTGYTGSGDQGVSLLVTAMELADIDTSGSIYANLVSAHNDGTFTTGDNTLTFPTLSVSTPTNKRFYVTSYQSLGTTGTDTFTPSTFQSQVPGGDPSGVARAFLLGTTETSVDLEVNFQETAPGEYASWGYLIAFETNVTVPQTTISDWTTAFDGTAVATATTVAGKFGNALTVTTASGGFNVVNNGSTLTNPNVVIGAVESTWSFWIKGSAAEAAIFEQGSLNDPVPIFYGIHTTAAGKIRYFDTTGGSAWSPTYNHNQTSTGTVLDGVNYHHVAIVRLGFSVKIYIDGSLDSTSTAGAIVQFPSQNYQEYCTILNSLPLGLTGTNIIVDDLAIWMPRALSAAEINDIYTRGVSNKSLLVQ